MNAMLQWLGALANGLGMPGFVRDTTYHSQQHNAAVVVRRGKLFTTVCVNGTDVYFNRFSGRIDGVGFSKLPNCTPAEARRAADDAS